MGQRVSFGPVSAQGYWSRIGMGCNAGPAPVRYVLIAVRRGLPDRGKRAPGRPGLAPPPAGQVLPCGPAVAAPGYYRDSPRRQSHAGRAGQQPAPGMDGEMTPGMGLEDSWV